MLALLPRVLPDAARKVSGHVSTCFFARASVRSVKVSGWQSAPIALGMLGSATGPTVSGSIARGCPLRSGEPDNSPALGRMVGAQGFEPRTPSV